MNIILYSSVMDEKAKAICGVLENLDPCIGLELHRTPGSLESRVMQPLNGVALMLLNVSTPKDLTDLTALEDRMHDLPVILILYDTTPEVTKKGRILRPRFIFSADDDPETVGLILTKMLARLNRDGVFQFVNKESSINSISEKIA